MKFGKTRPQKLVAPVVLPRAGVEVRESKNCERIAAQKYCTRKSRCLVFKRGTDFLSLRQERFNVGGCYTSPESLQCARKNVVRIIPFIPLRTVPKSGHEESAS